MSKIVKPKILSTKDVYKYYCKLKKEKGEEIVPYWMFKEATSRISKKASNMIIQGGILSLGNHLGYLKIRKINRTFKKSIVNWGETNKEKKKLLSQGLVLREGEKEGEDWLIYYTDPWYFRWAWIRRNGSSIFKNQTAYEFRPTSDRSKKEGEERLKVLGNKGKLVLANKKNSLLHLRYSEDY